MALLPPHRLRSTNPARIASSANGASLRRGRPARPRLAVLASVLLAGAGGVATVPATASAACAGANRSVASQGAAKAEAAVRCLVNQQRSAAGVRALRYSPKAARAAQRHTDDMVHRHYFSHVSPGGSTVGDRARSAGMPYRSIGENIAGGQRTPARVVRAWMNSAEHRANILNPGFRVLGVGVARQGAGGFSGATWTQVFARPRG
jgi:uncharacterized protein YkwD